MFKPIIIFVVSLSIASGQTWVSRARLRNYQNYFQNLVQEMIERVEAMEWCNLKQEDITQTIDDNLFNLHVNGTVEYTNGFLISVQKIDLTDIEELILSSTVNGEAVPFGTIRGKLNFRDVLVGYDVKANLESPPGEYRATGTFPHTLVQFQLDITQNLKTKEFRSSSFVLRTSGGSGVRMQYMPASHITQALSRRFRHSTFGSASNWARNIFGPILIDVAKNKLGFPDICFSNCSI